MSVEHPRHHIAVQFREVAAHFAALLMVQACEQLQKSLCRLRHCPAATFYIPGHCAMPRISQVLDNESIEHADQLHWAGSHHIALGVLFVEVHCFTYRQFRAFFERKSSALGTSSFETLWFLPYSRRLLIRTIGD